MTTEHANRPITPQAAAAILGAEDHIIRRRFGKRHEKPCKNPCVLSCAMSACQFANCCQWDVANR